MVDNFNIKDVPESEEAEKIRSANPRDVFISETGEQRTAAELQTQLDTDEEQEETGGVQRVEEENIEQVELPERTDNLVGTTDTGVTQSDIGGGGDRPTRSIRQEVDPETGERVGEPTVVQGGREIGTVEEVQQQVRQEEQQQIQAAQTRQQQTEQRRQRQIRRRQERRERGQEQLILRANGRTGPATEQGRRFFEEQQRLEELPSFSLTEPSVAGELARSTSQQLVEAEKTFVDVGQDLFGIQEGTVQTEAVDIPGTDLEVDLDNLFEGRGQPRQAFRETSVPLSVLQGRIEEQISEEEEERQRQIREPGLQSTREIPTGLELLAASSSTGAQNVLADLGIGEPTTLTEERARTSEAGAFITTKFAQEVPEKTTETSALLGLGASTLREPGTVGRELATGAPQIARQTVREPVEFGFGEFVPDVTLDILTGGGAAVAVPQVERVATGTGTRVRETGRTVRRGAQEIRELRQGAREGPGLLDSATIAAAQNLPQQQVLTVDTVTPTEQPQITPETEEVPIDAGPTPQELETLDIISTSDDLTNAGAANTQLETDLGISTPTAIADARPESTALDQAVNQFETDFIGESITEPVAQPEAESIAQPVATPIAETQVVAQPQVLPEVIPQARVQAQPRIIGIPDLSVEGFEQTQRTEVERPGQGFRFQSSIDAILTGDTLTVEEAESQGLFDQTFTGLETRPVIVENGNGDLEEEEEINGNGLTGLFNSF